MALVAVGKKEGRFVIGSGKGVNPGSLAGGAPGATAKAETANRVFGKKSVYDNFTMSPRPGGLIDKRQQNDPTATAFGHPFDNGDYRSTATGQNGRQVPPKTGVNVTQLVNPLTHFVPEIAPHERGTFFRRKPVPAVKTQFGANKSGAKADTAFHPQPRRVIQHPQVRSAVATEKLMRSYRPPSFESTGNLWGSANHSFIEGRPNSISGDIGKGRWQTIKRGAVK